MPSSVTSRPFALLTMPLVALLFIIVGQQTTLAQNITTVLTVFDNVGNSTDLRIGINSAASDAIDASLGEVELSPLVPGAFDARLIDNDFRSPSLLGNGVLKDLRGIFTAPPISQTFEVMARRDPGASNTWMRWSLPLATGISTMRLVSYPNPGVLDVDMSTLAQVELPVGTNRYFIEVTYGDPPPTRYTLNVEIDPPLTGQVFRIPFQPDYAPGQPVTLVAFNLPAPDTCYRFSHWEGDASGTANVLNISMTKSKNITAHFAPRKFPVTTTQLDTFVVDLNPPDPQWLYITPSALACNNWTVAATVPWLRLSKSAASGVDSIEVEVVTSAIPCPGTHAGTIELRSPFHDPEVLEIPVILRIGRTTLTARVDGVPSILSCQKKAVDLITVTLFNDGLNAVNFGTAPNLGDGFILKNPNIFPLTLPARDSVKMYVEFAPLDNQRGTIIENVILSADNCGQEILFKLEASRVAPTVTADAFELDFGLVNSCDVDPLPRRSIVLTNAYSQPATLRYTMPSGFTLVSAPASIPAGDTVTITVEPARNGAATFNATMNIDADFGICMESFSIDLFGERQDPSFFAEAVDTPGSLPPQLFDTTCVGSYSGAKNIRLVNDGSAELMMTIAVAPPFEIDAFSNTFPLAPGTDRIVSIRFHPVASGTFEQTLTISANLCALEASVDLRGGTFSQQILTSTVTPAHLTLADCEENGRMLLRVTNTGSEPVRFDDLPSLPNGFSWDAAVTLPIVINPDPTNPFEAYIVFAPELGDGGAFGGSVQWFGKPCGSTVYFTVSGERILPQVTITPRALDFGQIISCSSTDIGPTRVITIENNSPLPITLNALAAASKYELRLGPGPFPTQGVQIAANDSREIDVVALAGNGGAFNDTLMLTIIAGTGGTCREDIPVVLTGERFEPKFLVRENGYSTNFGDVCVDGSQVRGFILENTGDRRLTVTSSGFSPLSPFQLLAKPFKITLEPGAYREFPIRYNPLQVGQDVATILFQSDVCSDTVEFTVRGRGVQPSFAVTSVMPDTPIQILTCENIKSRQIRATVSNTSSTPVRVVDGSLLPAGFAYDPPEQFPFTLQPGQTRDVLVRFSGTDPGNYSGLVNLIGEPCDISASFAVEATVLSTAYTITPEAIDFGMITICPGGAVRPSDMEKLRQSIAFLNGGDIAQNISVSIKPANAPLSVLSPLTWPTIVPAGMMQEITLALTPPFDEMTNAFSGVIEVTVVRDQRCVPETRSIPFSGMINRMDYAFSRDTVRAAVSCITEPVELTAEVVNMSATPMQLNLRIEGSSAFMLEDGQNMLSLQPRERRAIRVRYAPTDGQPNMALLFATEPVCRSEVAAVLMVDYTQPQIALSCSETGGAAPQVTARPGDMVEIPVYLLDALDCEVTGATLSFELAYDRQALTPDRVISAQGTTTFTRPSPDKLMVNVTGTRFSSGELLRVVMEVLVGRTATTEWTVSAAAMTPPIALVVTDEACTGTINVRPRNGVTTLSDLGITSLNPPRPNVLDTKTGRTTQVTFTLKQEGFVELKVYDMLGVEAEVLQSGMLKRGTHSLQFATDRLRPGIYFIVMTSGTTRSTQKLIVAN
ncbi:MAG: T9SS type A sorting domain-containing protein [Bacteroidetes bacterium]|nr:T9SS type A sorting domain-containing protein [Bacteroidota bacterium]